MKKTLTNERTKKLVLMALFTAIVAILSYFGGFIKIGGLASISLTLIPVVLGSAIFGPLAGAWLGLVSGAVFFLTPDAAGWFSLDVLGTVITVLIKGAVSGLFAGIFYNLFKKANKYLAVIISAIVCPVVNTSIFLIGCRIFFWDTVLSGAQGKGMGTLGYLIVFFEGLNFVFELIVNIVVSPAILKLINIQEKNI